MKRNFVIMIAAMALIGAGALSWSNLRAAADARAESRRLSEQSAALEREFHALATRRASVDNHTKSASPAAAKAAASMQVNSPSTPHVAPPDASTLMAQNPALRDLFQRYTQAQLGFQFRPFYHAAKLSPEMITRFQALILEQRQEDMDLASASRASDLTPEDAAKLRADQQRQHETQLRQLLGDDDYAHYQEFTRVQSMEAAVASVATLGAETGEPLTEAQGDRLLTILAKNSRSYQSGGQADEWTLDLPQLLIETEPILSPHQFAVLRGDADLAQAFKLAEQYQMNQTRNEPATH